MATAMPRAEAARDVLLIRSLKRVTDLVISYPFSVSSLADEVTSNPSGRLRLNDSHRHDDPAT